MCNERIFRNGSFRELKIAKKSNDLADLAKVLPESYQKSNEFSVNRKCGQHVAADDRRTVTDDKDKVRRVQTLGNDTKMPCWTAKVAFIRVRINVIVISLGLVKQLLS